MNGPIGEWVLEVLEQPEKVKRENVAYSVIGGFKEASEEKSAIPAIVRRQPWEAFEEISFRCIQDAETPKE